MLFDLAMGLVLVLARHCFVLDYLVRRLSDFWDLETGRVLAGWLQGRLFALHNQSLELLQGFHISYNDLLTLYKYTKHIISLLISRFSSRLFGTPCP